MISETEALIAQLTEREREIVALVAEAARNQEIADRLGISVITVRHHLSSIFSTLQPLGVTDRTKLAVFALRSGLVPLSTLKPVGIVFKEPLKTVIEEPVLPPATEFVSMVRSIVQAEIADIFKTTALSDAVAVVHGLPERKRTGGCFDSRQLAANDPPHHFVPIQSISTSLEADAVKAAIRDSDAVSDIIKDKY